MEKGTHGINEESFEELDFAGQARAINGTARIIEKAIIAHLRRASTEKRDDAQIRQTYIGLLQRLICRIQNAT